jgi:hypothetical protein
MYLVDALTVLLRRWYVVLAGVLVLAGGGAAVVAYVPTTYQSSGQMVLLLPPAASGTETPVNPYLNLQTGLTTAASLVSGAASTKDAEEEMKDAGFDAEYAVAVVPGTGPLISVTAKDSDGAEATATRDEMMAWIDRELLRLQDEVGVPRAQYISATRSSVSRTAEALPGSKLRALAALGAVVGLLTLVLTFGIDRLLLRRKARRDPEPGTAPVDEPAKSATRTHDEAEVSEAETVREPQVDSASARDEGNRDGLVLTFHSKQAPGKQRRDRSSR